MNNNRHLTLTGAKDQIFQGLDYPKPFAFNDQVADVFDDMVSRSVPLYHEVNQLGRAYVSRYYQKETILYDLGCSTGTFLSFVSEALPSGAHLVGVDSSAAMIEKAAQKLKPLPSRHRVDLQIEDLAAMALEPCSVVVLNYTLQFLPVKDRAGLLRRIYQALLPGGLLFFSEKIRSLDPEIEEAMTRIYEAFKVSQGYTWGEVQKKKEALDQVLVSFSEDQYRSLLCDAGFQSQAIICKWQQFATFVALKAPAHES